MRKKIISIIAALVITTILVYIFCIIQKEQSIANINSRRLLAMQKLVFVSDGIQTEFTESLKYADFFDVIISKDPNITKETMNDYAALILRQNKNIDSVQLAPGGIVSMIYPLKGNEAAIGHNLLTDSKRKKYVEEAIKKRVSVAQGPVKAKQGGYLVFNRKAIFITKNGKEQFWGLSIIAMNFTKLMEGYKNELKKENYLFVIRANKGDKEQEVYWGDETILQKDALINTIALPDNEWEIAIYPKNGWTKDNQSIRQLKWLFYVVAFCSFFLIYWSVYFYQEKIDESKREFLTGTLNKKALKAFILKKLLKRNQRHGMLLLDLNNFKEINDKLGHPVGDAVLIEVSKRINGILRSTDRLSRFGGDEYLVFISNISNEAEVKLIMDKIVEQVALPMMINELPMRIGISAGYAIYPEDGDTFKELYEAADKNMYEDKVKNGRYRRSEYLSREDTI